MTTVLYGKLGRVVEVEPHKWGAVGGDNEASILLLELADRHPDVTWAVVSKNSGWRPPRPNIVNKWLDWRDDFRVPKNTPVAERIARWDKIVLDYFREADGVIMWLGQHGTSNMPLPTKKDRSIVTVPQESFVNYCSYLYRGINAWRDVDPISREEIYLCSDVRNYLKSRDGKWPLKNPILAQYDWSRTGTCERFEDPLEPQRPYSWESPGVWAYPQKYIGSGLELTGVPPAPASLPPWEDRMDLGMLINENRNYGYNEQLTRLFILKNWVMPENPDWVNGKWTDASQAELGRSITPLPYPQIFDRMASTKATLTTPASGSAWATAKPWESFASGTICFFHPGYDVQGHIIPTKAKADPNTELGHLVHWLRCDTAEEFRKKLSVIRTDEETYNWLRDVQLRHLKNSQKEARCIRLIEARLKLEEQAEPVSVFEMT